MTDKWSNAEEQAFFLHHGWDVMIWHGRFGYAKEGDSSALFICPTGGGWAVSHGPLDRQIIRFRGKRAAAATALRFAERIEPLADWAAITSLEIWEKVRTPELIAATMQVANRLATPLEPSA